MAKNKSKRDSLPEHFKSLAEFIEFWDNHAITEYPKVWRATDLKVNLLKRAYSVPLDARLAKKLESIARTKKTTVRRLVSRWLEEKLRAA
ncbi:MAG: hypothetical protein HY257_03305 [Chloroflexi bacterium]|nr:hypothetical protein [Chloroflexota bacterium]